LGTGGGGGAFWANAALLVSRLPSRTIAGRVIENTSIL
jgi:hypothetical protein